MVAAGEISVRLERIFPLEKARQALEESRTGHVRGKIVLLVEEEHEPRVEEVQGTSSVREEALNYQ